MSPELLGESQEIHSQSLFMLTRYSLELTRIRHWTLLANLLVNLKINFASVCCYLLLCGIRVLHASGYMSPGSWEEHESDARTRTRARSLILYDIQ